MKFIYTLILTLTVVSGYSQISKPSTSQVYTLLKSTVDQPFKKNIRVGAGEWLICNQDSAFFKNDTLRLYSNLNYFYQLNKCCDFIGWTFYRKNAFVQSKSQICNEPASSSANSEFHEIQLISKNKSTVMLVRKQGVVVQMFEIISLDKVALANNNSSNVITLKRLK